MSDDLNRAKERRAKVQAAEKESRDGAREEAHFNADKWGHWEDYATRRFEGRPRYQLDMVKPVIDSIAGQIEQLEFGGSVIPTGTSGNEQIAETYEKMLRTISNMSDAACIYQSAGRDIVDHGFDAWLVLTDWADVDAFDQDILIEPLPNAIDRVWIEGAAGATKASDIKGAFVDTFLSNDEYKEMFPEGSGESLGEVSDFHRYRDQPKDGVLVSDFYYIKNKRVTLHLLSDNRVVKDEEYETVKSDLAARGISSMRTRERMIPTCFMRKFDNKGWLTEEQRTPFSYIPVVACYGNYRVLEDRALYSGETRKLMDPQRIYDYAVSKDISDGALGRKDKIARTAMQGEGHENQNRRLNQADDPEYLYNADAEAPPPYIIAGSQVDQNNQIVATRAQTDIKEISMSHQPQQGQGLSGHSGKAYEILNDKADTATVKYVKALEKSIAWTYEIIIDAIPRVYDTRNRQVRLTNEDGTGVFTAVNEEIPGETGGLEVINDLSHGRYMFKVTSGPAFTSRRAEGVAAVREWAALDPTIIEEGKDIIYNALNAPGFNDIADRVRKRKIEGGEIPESQLTDEEREKIAQEMQAQAESAQNQQPDPIQEASVQALLTQVQDAQSQMQERQVKLELAAQEQERKMLETMAKIGEGRMTTEANVQKTQSETLENLKDATGADAIINPKVAVAYDDIAGDMVD